MTVPGYFKAQIFLFLRTATDPFQLKIISCLPLSRKKKSGRAACVFGLRLNSWSRKYVCVVGVCAVPCSFHLCGSTLLYQVATCSFLVQKESWGPRQKGGAQTLGEANEALGLPNTGDDKWGPSLSGFIIESPWVCPNHGNRFKQ